MWRTPLKNRRVCHLTSVHKPSDNRVFHKECKTLAGAGYDVTLVATHDRSETVDGVKIHALSAPQGRFGRMTTTVRAVHRAALELNADLYHFHDPELILVGSDLERRGYPVVYDVHEDYGGVLTEKPWLPSRLRRPISVVASFLERGLSRRLSAIVAAGTDIEKIFEGDVRRLVRVENYPILDEVLLGESEAKAPGFVLSNFGGVSSGRVTDVLVEALGLLPGDSQCRMVLGGRVMEQELYRRSKAMPGWQRVEELGFVDRSTLVSANLSSHVSVNLYSDSPNHQGIRSNRVYEAMVAGLPILVSNMPEWQAFIDRHRCGLAVDPADPRSIADAITDLERRPDEAAAMGSRGRQAVIERYNWSVEADKLLDLYSELLP